MNFLIEVIESLVESKKVVVKHRRELREDYSALSIVVLGGLYGFDFIFG